MSQDPWAALRTLRIGCVKYLNSRPLICGYDGPVVFEHPSVLAGMLADGELDAALVPTFEVLRSPNYQLVDGAGIACDGPVYSVILAYRGPLREIRNVALDPASLSSVNLLRVLLGEFHQLEPHFGAEGDARLIIGNQAIEFRMTEETPGQWSVLDLGEEWKRCTGLPFVFALWALRPGLDAEAAAAFRKLKKIGVGMIPAVVAEETFATPELRARYLTHHIRFDVGPDGRAAITRYRELLMKHRLIAESSRALRFI